MDYVISTIKEIISNNQHLFLFIKYTVVAFSFYFLLNVVYNNSQHIFLIFSENLFFGTLTILFCSIIYVFLLLILANSWKCILNFLENEIINTAVVSVYLKSQIYKYLPGNIFHYVNRQASASQLVISHKSLFKSSFFEAFSLIISAILCSILIIDNSLIRVGIISSYFLFLLFFYSRNRRLVKTIQLSQVYYLVYFICIGVICFLVTQVLEVQNLVITSCIAIYALSWLAGFIIPGAPGGLGVRESVFILLSSSQINSALAITIIATMRIITTLGEFIAYFVPSLIHLPQSDTLDS